MRKLITLTLTVLLVGLFAAVVFAAVEAGDDPAGPAGTSETTQTTGTTTPTQTTTAPDDDRAHGRRDDDDPRPGAQGTAPQPGVDISGPCDEAEHAADPRCTGAAPPAAGGRVDDHGGDDHGHGDRGRVDNSGPGSVSSGRDDDLDDHGRDDGFDDHDAEDDHSGSGHGGDDEHGGGDDDNSGHGGGDDD